MPALLLCVSCASRIDLHMEVLPVEYEKLSSSRPEESSASVRQRVMEARKRQEKRFAGTGISCNAQIPPALLQECCPLEPAAEKLLAAAFERMGLSARGYGRILKVARTVADLEGAEKMAPPIFRRPFSSGGLTESTGAGYDK